MIHPDQLPSIGKIGLFVMFFLFINMQNFAFTNKDNISKKPSSNNPSNTSLNLTGDTNLCLVIGIVLGTYSAGGEIGDVYHWTITNSNGEIIDNKRAGGLETYRFLFREDGQYLLNLTVSRGTINNFYEKSLPITVQRGPKLALLPDYLLCGSDPAILTALDPDTPDLGVYSIIWTDNQNNVVGTENELIAQNPGTYNVLVQSPSCEIQGSAFVGPALDFIIETSTEQLCEGNSVNIKTDTPIAGKWFIQKEGSSTRESLGEAFELTLNYNDFPNPGKYDIFFVVVDPNYSNCPSERRTSIEILERLKITAKNITKPYDCNSTDGSFDIVANSAFEYISIAELGFYESGITAGTTFNFIDLKSGFYVIEAVQNGCKSKRVISLESTNSPRIEESVDITFSDEVCSTNGIYNGMIKLNFKQVVNNAYYRIISKNRGVVEEKPISSIGTHIIDVVAGKYYIEITIDGCIYSFKEVTIAKKPEVTFSVPRDFKIFESFNLIPATSQKLIFTLIYPDGSQKSVNSGDGFDLTEEGVYSITGVDENPNSKFCSKTIKFKTSFFKQFSYQPILTPAGCFDPISYAAQIDGLNYNEVTIRWLNSEGDIVGRFPTFYPFDEETYTLSIQPKKSGFYIGNSMPFTVVVPVSSVDMELNVSPLCPAPQGATLSIVVDREFAKSVQWIFYDPSNNRQELDQFNDMFEIQVDQAGSYEAVAYNSNGCEIARELKLIEKSDLSFAPVIESIYAICSLSNSIKPINPGKYEKYEWKFRDQVISDLPTFTPDKIGTYTLTVMTADNCLFVADFTTFDACDFKVVFPNAMQLENPDKDFRVVVSESVKEAELFLLNKQGELIFHRLETDISTSTSILHWDGKFNGRNVPAGNYSVIVFIKNQKLGVEQKLTRSLIVLD